MKRLTEKFKDESYCISDIRAIRKETFYEDMECSHGYDLYIGKAIDKLAEYENLEEQGKLLKLPCAVGGTVWFIKSNFAYMKNPKAEKVRKIEIIDGEIIFRTENRCFEMKRIGKTVFLTEEEAEVALKELERGRENEW